MGGKGVSIPRERVGADIRLALSGIAQPTE
jgi:hypothetical protein